MLKYKFFSLNLRKVAESTMSKGFYKIQKNYLYGKKDDMEEFRKYI